MCGANTAVSKIVFNSENLLKKESALVYQILRCLCFITVDFRDIGF